MLDPRLLRVLDEVARTGSYSAAGRALGYSQPAVTQQMHALQRAVGAPVVMRAGHSMRLTPVGEVLARHAAAMMRSVRAAQEEAADLVGRHSGRVRVAAFASACATLLPLTMRSLARSHPQLHTELVTAEPDEAFAGLAAGDCDVVVGYDFGAVPPGPPVTPDAAASPARPAEPDAAAGSEPFRLDLLAERMLLVMPANHPGASRRWASPKDFDKANWIAGSEQGQARLQSWVRGSGFEPRVSIFVDDYVAMQALVAAGRGVGVLADLAWSAHRHPGVVALPVRQFPLRRVHASCWPQMREVPTVAATLDALQATAALLGRSDPAR